MVDEVTPILDETPVEDAPVDEFAEFRDATPDEIAATSQAPVDEFAEFRDATPDELVAAGELQEFSMLQSGFLGGVQGVTAGFGDEFTAGVEALFDKAGGDERAFSEIFDERVIPIRAFLAEAERQNPGSFLTGEVAGAIATLSKTIGVGAAKLVAKGLSKKTAGGVAQATAVAAGEGAITGGVFAAGAAEDDKLKAAEKGAVVGTLFGPAGLAAGRAASAGINTLMGRFKNIPQLDVLRVKASEAYTRAENTGAIITQPAFARFADGMGKTMQKEGFDPGLNPKANVVLTRILDTVGQSPTIQQMEILRRVAQNAKETIDPSDVRMAGIIVDKLDDFMVNLQPKDTIAGSAEVAVAALKEARSAWRKFRGGQAIDEMFEQARIKSGGFSGLGMEKALTGEFRRFASNKRKMRVFNPVEQAAIKRVATGGSAMSMNNIARFFSKFAPTGFFSAGLSAGAFTAGGGLALPIAGTVGRLTATEMTKRAATRAGEVIRGGGQVPPPVAGAETASRLTQRAIISQPPNVVEGLEELR